jgi:hypothetical protein
MKESLPLIVLAFLGLPVSGSVVLISFIVVVVIVVGAIFLIVRNGQKKKAVATGSNSDWQHQAQAGAWNQQGAWGQQGPVPGQWAANPAAAQAAGNWPGGPQNPWGTPQQPPINPWGQPVQQPQPANPWGSPAEQQPPANPWMPAQQPQSTNPWGTPPQQPQSANPWGQPVQQPQPANPWGPPAQQPQSANPWEAVPAPVSQDPWGQQQAVAQQQQAWGMQAAASAPVLQQSQAAPTAFGGSVPVGNWGQTQQADPWGNPAAAASPGSQPSGGFQATGAPSGVPGWQQGGMGSSATGFAGNEADKTVLRPPAGQQNGAAVGYVQVKEGKEPGRVYEIRKESLSIGRSRESDIFLEDLAVSRLHASIVNLGNGTYSLKDEGSANGTKVNDQLVDKFKTHQLQEGDQIQLGQTVLVFARH